MPRAPNLPVSAAGAARSGGIWATIGYGGQLLFPPQASGGKLARWDGRRWKLGPLPARLARDGDPASIAALPARDLWVGGGIADTDLRLAEGAARWDGSAWQVIKVPAQALHADCVFRALVRFRDRLVGPGDCFSDANPGKVWSRLWRLSAGRWIGPVRPRIRGRVPVLLDLARAGRPGSAWAVGFAGDAGAIALYGLGSR